MESAEAKLRERAEEHKILAQVSRELDDVADAALHTPTTRARRAELALRWLEADGVRCGQWIEWDVVRYRGGLLPPPPGRGGASMSGGRRCRDA